MFRYSFLILMFLFPISSYSNWQGSGTSSNPYEIWTLDDLNALADSINTRNFYGRNLHFKLMADVDTFKNVIGHNNPIIAHRWNHHFDGNGFTITVNINRPSTPFTGLFGFADKNSIVENLTLAGEVLGRDEVGGIIGTNWGIVRHCINNASVAATHGYVGGITGANPGTVKYCTNNGPVEALNSHSAGGIVGWNRSSIHNCVNNGRVKSASNFAGGITSRGISDTGIDDNITMLYLNNINTGTIEGTGRVGGIIGSVRGASKIKVMFCSNYGFVKGNNSVGGIVGELENVTPINILREISNNFSSGVVVGNSKVGCIIGDIVNTNTGILIIENNHYDKQMCGEED